MIKYNFNYFIIKITEYEYSKYLNEINIIYDVGMQCTQ